MCFDGHEPSLLRSRDNTRYSGLFVWLCFDGHEPSLLRSLASIVLEQWTNFRFDGHEPSLLWSPLSPT